MESRGAYTAKRAAALSGVPKSTLHWWARERVLIPSASASKQRSWSFAELMALRTLTAAQIQQAIELEQQLATNLAVPAAA